MSHMNESWHMSTPNGSTSFASVVCCLHVLVCNTLQHTATNCNTLQHTATHRNTLQHTTTLCNTLQHTATHCNTLQHTATHCNTLQHTATHCNTLQHSATHCNTLQHSATHYNTLQHTLQHTIQQMCKCQSIICHLPRGRCAAKKSLQQTATHHCVNTRQKQRQKTLQKSMFSPWRRYTMQYYKTLQQTAGH